MSKANNRREQFESQLRDLQKDISTLSHKLNVTTSAFIHPASSHTLSSSSSTNTIIGSSNGNHVKGANDAMARHSMKSIEHFNMSPSYPDNNQVQKDESIVEKLRQEILLYKQDIHLYKKERDEASYRHEQCKLQVEDLRQSLQDSVRIKAAYDHLKQDYDAVKISLESSERIRKQQKELITLLQRSHSIAVAADSSSVMSFNSLSSISVKNQDKDTAEMSADFIAASELPVHAGRGIKDNIIPSSHVDDRGLRTTATTTVAAGEQHTRKAIVESSASEKRSRRRRKLKAAHDTRMGPISSQPDGNNADSRHDSIRRSKSYAFEDDESRWSRAFNGMALDRSLSHPSSGDVLTRSGRVRRVFEDTGGTVDSSSRDQSYQSIISANNSLIPNNSYHHDSLHHEDGMDHVRSRSEIALDRRLSGRPPLYPTTVSKSSIVDVPLPNNSHALHEPLRAAEDYTYTAPALYHNRRNHESDFYEDLHMSSTSKQQQSAEEEPMKTRSRSQKEQTNPLSIRSRQSNLLMNRPASSRRVVGKHTSKVQYSSVTGRKFRRPVSCPQTTFGSADRGL